MHLRTAPLIALLLSTWILPSPLQAERIGNRVQGTGYSQQSATEDHLVTIVEYCKFLNEVATADPDNLHDEKMEGIVRAGNPGHYTYAVASGEEKKAITYVNNLSAKYYANWLEHSAASFCSCNLFPVTCELDTQLHSNHLFLDAAVESKELSQKEGCLEDTFFLLSDRTLAAFACIASLCTDRTPQQRELNHENSSDSLSQRSPSSSPTSRLINQSDITSPLVSDKRRESHYESFSSMKSPSSRIAAPTDTLSISAYADLDPQITNSHIVVWNATADEMTTKTPSVIVGIDLDALKKEEHQATRAHFFEKMKAKYSEEVAAYVLSKKTGPLTVGEVRASLKKANAIATSIPSLQNNTSNSSSSSDTPLIRLKSIVEYTKTVEVKALQASKEAGTQKEHLQEAAHQALKGLGYTATVALHTVALPVAIGSFFAAAINPLAMSSSILVSHLLPTAWEDTAVAASSGMISMSAGVFTGYHTMNTLSPTRAIYWTRAKDAFREAYQSMTHFFEVRTAQQQLAEKHAETQAAWTTYYQKSLSTLHDNNISLETNKLRQEAFTHFLTTWTPTSQETYQSTFNRFITIHETLYDKGLMSYVLPLKERASMIARKEALTPERAEQIKTKAEALKNAFDQHEQQASNANSNSISSLNQAIQGYTAQKTEEAKNAYTSLTKSSESPYYDALKEMARHSWNGLKQAAPFLVRPAIGAAVGAFVGALTGFSYGEWHALVVPTNAWGLERVLNAYTLAGARWIALVGAGMGTVDTIFPRRESISPRMDTLGSLSDGRLTWPEVSIVTNTRAASGSFSQAAAAITRMYQIYSARQKLLEAIKEQKEAGLSSSCSSEPVNPDSSKPHDEGNTNEED